MWIILCSIYLSYQNIVLESASISKELRRRSQYMAISNSMEYGNCFDLAVCRMKHGEVHST